MFGYFNPSYPSNYAQQSGVSVNDCHSSRATITGSPQFRARRESSSNCGFARTVVNPLYSQQGPQNRGLTIQNDSSVCRPSSTSCAIHIKSGNPGSRTSGRQTVSATVPSEPIKISCTKSTVAATPSKPFNNYHVVNEAHTPIPVAISGSGAQCAAAEKKPSKPDIAFLQTILSRPPPKETVPPAPTTTTEMRPANTNLKSPNFSGIPNIAFLKELLANDALPRKSELQKASADKSKHGMPLIETSFTSIGSSSVITSHLPPTSGEAPTRVHVLSGCTIQSIGKRRHDLESLDGNCSPSSEVGTILNSAVNPSADGSNHPTPEESSPLNTESTPTFSTPPLEETDVLCEDDFREVCSPWHQAPISPTRLSSIPLTNDQEMPTPVTCKLLEREGNRHFRSAAVAMNGFRTSMEDSHALICKEEYGFFGVFDGHAGPVCSAYCAKEIPAELERAGVPVSDAQLQELVLSLDTKFRTMHSRGGSTAAMVIATPTGGKKDHQFSLQIAHVGDSRVLVGSKGGVVKFSTTDHKPSLPAEQRRIESVGGFVKNDRVDGRLAMSRALGDDEFKRGSPDLRKLKVTALPDVSTFVCGRDDFVLIACDGVFEEMSNAEVVSFVSSQLQHTKDLGKVVAKLVDEALRKGSGDNITAALLQFKNGVNFKTPVEFIPGPYCPRKTQNFRAAYSYTSEKAGITFEKALNLRFQQLTEIIGETLISTIKAESNKQNPSLDDLVREVEEWAEENLFAFNDACRAIKDFVRPRLSAEQMATLNRIIGGWQKTETPHQRHQCAATYTNADLYNKQAYGYNQPRNNQSVYGVYGQQPQQQPQQQHYQGFHPYQQYQGQGRSYGR